MIISMTMTGLNEVQTEEVKKVVEKNDAFVRQGRLRFFHSDDYMIFDSSGKKEEFVATVLVSDAFNGVRPSMSSLLAQVAIFDKEATPKEGVVSAVFHDLAEAIRWDKGKI